MTAPETAHATHDQEPRTQPNVEVTLVVTDPEGEPETFKKTIPSGSTKVPDLKAELGVPAEASLWVTARGGKPKQLVDHGSHNVKAGDRFETIVKGGVS